MDAADTFVRRRAALDRVAEAAIGQALEALGAAQGGPGDARACDAAFAVLCGRGDAPAVAAALAAGRDPGALYEASLRDAARFGRLEVLALLLAARAWTWIGLGHALLNAAAAGHAAAVDLLLGAGAPPGFCTFAPARAAERGGHHQLARSLALAGGAGAGLTDAQRAALAPILLQWGLG